MLPAPHLIGFCCGTFLCAAGPDAGPSRAERGTVELTGPVVTAAAENQPPPAGRSNPVVLERVEVQSRAEDEGIETTGFGSYEAQLRDAAFSNDLISADALEDDPAGKEIASELDRIATPSAVDLATGDSRVGLRSFPTPFLTNGFVLMGGIDLLNVGRTVVIQGALVPVLGRGAPGGIMDFWTNRPRASRSRTLAYTISSLERQSASLELNDATVPGRAWHRIAVDWSRKTGPETFAAMETRSLSAALTWRHSSAASTLVSFDYLQLHGVAAPGIPEYRVVTGQKVVGPYRPIAGFNGYGPDAGIRRRSALASVIVDAQVHPRMTVRAATEAWWRRIEQDRFTTSLLNLTTGRFEGTREPLHSEQPQQAMLLLAEATGRFAARRSEHKVMLALSHTIASYLREERALALALRNALPATVRLFNPAAPDYRRTPYNPTDYSRILTDRRERTRLSALELTERMSIAKGRAVFTAGLRKDLVNLRLHDRRAGLTPAQAFTRDSVDELSYHLGANYQAVPGQLLLFSTASTAFNPSTRVDVRTGRIQGNETTRGYDGGLKTRLADGRLDLTATAFTFINLDISRRNPFYGDPVHDANHTQPQLVAAGEEKFTGGKLEGRWRPLPQWSFSLVGSYVRAITTASPDLPEEVGRRLSRFPPYNVGVASSYSFGPGRWQGLSLSGSWSYVSDFTAYYEDRQRFRLDYPGYGLANLSASYSRRWGTRTHSVALGVRNVFDRDLLAALARLGAGREATLTYRLYF